ncbi:amino acid/polyamine transporter I [Spinellus fusiger]|nr:amino acid/polyamine transporter I [Spinellus fusiger]
MSGLAFTNIGILSNSSATFQTVLQRGGPVTMLLSWNIVAGFMLCVAFSLSEICSFYPLSGGLYYWTYELLHAHPRGKQYAPVLAFTVGWIYAMANVISISATNVTVALSIGTILRILWDRVLDKYALMMITLSVTIVQGFINSRGMNALTFMNKLNVFWSCAGLFVIVVMLSVWAPHQSATWVFTHYENETGFDHPAYVFLLAMIGAAYSLFGCDSAACVNEETVDADIASPLAMTMSIAVSWFVGLIFLIVLLFSIQDINTILHSSFDMPVAQLLWDAVGFWGTLGFLLLIVVCQFCTGATTITVASRQIYALARDGAIPMSSYLCALDYQKLPSNAILCTVILASIVVLPFPLSENLFETIISATTITIHLAYAIVFACRLIAPRPIKGRFSLGTWSLPVTCISLIWTVFAVFAFMMPTSWPMRVDSANFSSVGLLIVVGSTVAFWLGWGRYHYTGPRASSDDI